MSKCINKNHNDFKQLVKEANINPILLSAKMGVWMEDNNTDEWPSLQQLGLSVHKGGVWDKVTEHVLNGDTEGKTSTEILHNITKNFNVSEEDSELIDKLSTINIPVVITNKDVVTANGEKVKFSKEYMMYVDRIIYINPDSVDKDTLDAFVESFLHEMVHAHTIREYDKNKQFKTTIDSLYKQLKFNSKITDAYGLSSPTEFMAEVMTNKVFIDSLKSNNYGFFRKLLDAIHKLIFGFTESKSNKELTEKAINIIDKVISNPKHGSISANELIASFKRKAKPKLDELEFAQDLGKLDTIQKVRDRAIKVLEYKLKQQKRYANLNSVQIEQKESFIRELNQLEAEQAMFKFTQVALKNTQAVHTKWSKILPNLQKITEAVKKGEVPAEDIEKVISIDTLKDLSDFVGAYDTVEDFSQYLVLTGKEDLEYTNDKGKKVKLIDTLSDVIKVKNAIQQGWEYYGKDIVAAKLAPFSDKIKNDYINELNRNWKDMTAADKSRYANEKEYVAGMLELKKANIRNATIYMLRQELDASANDINFGVRWLDNILNTSDAVAGAMSQMFKYAEYQAHSKKVEVQKELSDAYKDFKKEGTNKEVFDYMIDYDSKGQPYLVDRFGAKFWEAYDAIKDKINEVRKATDYTFTIARHTYSISHSNGKYAYTEDGQPIKQDMYFRMLGMHTDAIRKKWLKENAPLSPDKAKDFNDDLTDYINSLREQDILSDDELVAIFSLGQYDGNYQKLVDEGRLNETASKLIYRWISDNIWEYRSPDSKWVDANRKYYDLQGLVNTQPRSPEVVMYKAILNTQKQINELLPASARLKHGRLPAIRKDIAEQRAEGASFTKLAKDIITRAASVMVDESAEGEKYTDANGRVVYHVPIYYTNKLEPSEYSFDLPTSYFKMFANAADYNSKSNILPTMELARHSVATRDKLKKDKEGNIKKIKSEITGKDTAIIENEEATNLSAQLNDWFTSVMYGVHEKKIGTKTILGKEVDVDKLITLLNKYTGLNMLALNFKAGVSNVMYGETMQKIEALANQHLSFSTLTKASIEWDKQLSGLMSDVGSTIPTNKINLLLEHLNIAESTLNPNITDGKMMNLAKTSTLFFMSKIGDNWMTSRMFIGMMMEKEVFDKDGKSLGNLYDNYTAENGELKLNSKVDLEKSGWTTLEQSKWSNKTNRILATLHQEMDESGKAAIQMYGLGKMAIMFRRFILPGIQRRWAPERYREGFGDYTEGYYRTTFNFLGRIIKESKGIKMSAIGAEWDDLSDMEKSNIIRMAGEMTLLCVVMPLLVMAIEAMKEGGDDDKDKWALNFAHYAALRMRAENKFFWNPGEAFKLLRSPVATMGVIDNIGKITSQMTDPFEVYQRGSHKDENKLKVQTLKLLPFYKTLYQTYDIEEQLNFMK